MSANIWKQISTQWSLWKYAVPVAINAILSILCYIGGWMLSTPTDRTWFARAGAAATAIAIVFAVNNYHKALETSQADAASYFANITKQLPLTGAASQQRVVNKLQANTRLAAGVITSMQTAILVIATLVWGFGDLLSFK
jgi:hypothetical protein